MQTLLRASFKNNYPYQILIILASNTGITRAYNFMIKRIPRGFNIFTRENTRCYVSLPIPYTGSPLSRGHQTVTIMNVKNILFLNVSAKNRDARGATCHLVLMMANL